MRDGALDRGTHRGQDAVCRMAQVESEANLDRWTDPAGRLITLILMRCGLRIFSALTLDFDCLIHDAQDAPYLR